MAKALMIQGTGSGVGKSLVVTALCRIFKDMGVDVAPFKAQNMALNAYVTREGGEIGVAQALQAFAAGIEPEIDMNPILLKPSGESGVQIVIHGKAYKTMKARGYYGLKHRANNAIRSSFKRLSKSHALIIIEGAGSPAEINLMKDDIVNMAVARYANAPVLLVGDIDKGGVFASFYGTVKLLGRDSRYIKAFIINKFRGDLNLLKPGLKMIEDKTNRPVIGVIPYMNTIGLLEEDGAYMEEIQNSKFKTQNSELEIQNSKFKTQNSELEIQNSRLKTQNSGLEIQNSRLKTQNSGLGIQDPLKIVVVKLPYISNFTDFEPFYFEPDVELFYSDNRSDIEHADIVIIPGTKNTMDALVFLKQTGLHESIKRAYAKGTQIIGICGGYQILGKKLLNPYGVEGRIKTLDGIGILPIKTVFQEEKITAQVEAGIVPGAGFGFQGFEDIRLKGYEIHHGISTGDVGVFKINRISRNPNIPSLPHLLEGKKPDSRFHGNDKKWGGDDHDKVFCTTSVCESVILDGSKNKNCFGTYMHGIFDNDEFRRAILNSIRMKKGLKPLKHTFRYAQAKDRAIDRFTDSVKQHLDVEYIKKLIGM